MTHLTYAKQPRYDCEPARCVSPAPLVLRSQACSAGQEARLMGPAPVMASSQFEGSGVTSGFGWNPRTWWGAHGAQDASAHEPQRIAIPSYFTPAQLWEQMRAGAPNVGLAIVNPDSGPASAINHRYLEQVRQCQAAGLRVLGYVYTRYADGSRTQAAVQDAIDRYFDWYAVDGIVFDEVSPDRAKQPYYAALNSYVKTKASSAITVINPGTRTHESYMAAADIVVTFEGAYAAYLSRYSAPGWIKRYAPSRFWHLIHSTSRILDMRNAVRLSKERRAGWVYVTSDRMPKPWDTLPKSEYWDAELRAVAEQ